MNYAMLKESLRLFIAIATMAITMRLHAAGPPMLTLREAQERALRNHPRISVANLRALAAKEVTRETRSSFFPTLTANVTAASGADVNNTRLAAGFLNNPSVFQRNSEGLILNQLITDFGRTANLTASAKFRAKADEENAEATRAQIVLQVSAAYFSALQAQAVLRVAGQTVTTRQFLLDQIRSLASNKLRSELDVGLARVSFEEGRLLQSRASNDVDAAFTSLSALLGERETQSFQIVEEPLPAAFPTNTDALIVEALSRRPDLIRFRFEHEAALKLARAEKALHYPVISAVASAGVTPIHDSHLENNYAAAGVNLSLPLFNGFLFSSRQKEAELKAAAAAQALRDEENNAISGVRIAWLNANNALERLHISEQLLVEARKTYALAEARYKFGSSSFVELSQAQLNALNAEIGNARARYETQLQEQILRFQTGTIVADSGKATH
jgi:outer membrane protein